MACHISSHSRVKRVLWLALVVASAALLWLVFPLRPSRVAQAGTSHFDNPLDTSGRAPNALPDLTAAKTNNVGGVSSVGDSFTWTVTLENIGSGDASFSSGQVVFRDDLPPGAIYGAPTVQNTSNVDGWWYLDCHTSGYVLTCTPLGGTLYFWAGGGRFDVAIPVTPTVGGALTNPTGGICRVDPDNVDAETNESNNDCGDTVVVNTLALGRKMYVTNTYGNNVTRADLDGSGALTMTLGNKLAVPYGLALDLPNRQLYVVNFSGSNITRANLDGGSATNLTGLGLYFPTDLALDLTNGKLYVSQTFVNPPRNDYIVWAGLDGSSRTGLGDLHGAGIAVDPAASKVYVASGTAVIRADLDGTGAMPLTLNGLLDNPIGIALDLANGKMYVTNAGNNTVSVADLDGSNASNIGDPGNLLSAPKGIALDVPNGQMYIVSSGNNTIVRANLNGSGGISLGNLNGTLQTPYGIALDLSGATHLYLPFLYRR